MTASRLLGLASVLLGLACQEGPPPAENGAEPARGPTPTWLTADGWGELRVGMTRQEIVAAMGEAARLSAPRGLPEKGIGCGTPLRRESPRRYPTSHSLV